MDIDEDQPVSGNMHGSVSLGHAGRPPARAGTQIWGKNVARYNAKMKDWRQKISCAVCGRFFLSKSDCWAHAIRFHARKIEGILHCSGSKCNFRTMEEDVLNQHVVTCAWVTSDAKAKHGNKSQPPNGKRTIAPWALVGVVYVV